MTALDSRGACVSNVTGKNFAFAAEDPAQYREWLVAASLPAFIVDAVLSIQDMRSAGGFEVTTGDVERLASRPLRSFEVCFEMRSSRSRGVIMQR